MPISVGGEWGLPWGGRPHGRHRAARPALTLSKTISSYLNIPSLPFTWGEGKSALGLRMHPGALEYGESTPKPVPSQLKTSNAVVQACPGIKLLAAFLSGHDPKPTDFNVL